MSGFTQVFGGTTIAPANASFLSLVMAASVELAWPIEQAINGNVVADTIEVVASAPGLNIDLPDARQVSTGYTTCFNNTGPNTVTVRNATGANLLSLISGTAWVLYLADNSTEGGTWRVFQLGASVSVAVAAALAGAGLRAITTTLNQDIPVTSYNVTPTTLIDTDRAKLMNWTGGLGVLNLPTPGVVGNGWYVQIRNSGSGDLTVTPPSGTIDGAATKTFASGTSAVVVTDGTDYYTLGFGSGAGGGGGGFDFVEIDVAGSGDFILAGANLNRISYRFIGVLTGTRNIVVPNAVQQYWVNNATTGAFSLFVKTAAQSPGIEILQNDKAILYCDGANVIDAESSTVTFPIPVTQGGTGAVDAASARTNLGAGATGSNIFVAGSQAAAQLALGIALATTNIWTAVGTHAAPTMELSSARPILGFNETDAAADNRRWSIEANSEALQFHAANDAGSVSSVWLTVNRTATTIDGINFPNGILEYTGIEVGWKSMPSFVFPASYALAATDKAYLFVYTGAGGHTLTLNALPPPNTVLMVLNSGTGNLLMSATSSLSWSNGSGTVPVGNRLFAVGGIATVYHVGSGIWRVWGAGLS